jgi:ADP-ribose pyrophosphatase YjhB (NUDIX family)
MDTARDPADIRRAMATPTDADALQLPVSVKGVLVRDGDVLLLQDPRGAWELPGGTLQAGESPASCLVRGIAEELGLEVAVDRPVHVWVDAVPGGVDVLLVAYACTVPAWPALLRSPEGRALGLFPVDALPAERLPEGHRQAVGHATAG